MLSLELRFVPDVDIKALSAASHNEKRIVSLVDRELLHVKPRVRKALFDFHCPRKCKLRYLATILGQLAATPTYANKAGD
jgi:hypothetical protein